MQSIEQAMSVDEARHLTERIRHAASTVAESVEKLRALVEEAKAGSAHLLLGYASWTAYISDVLGSQPLRLERDVRRELVGYLSSQDMSTRAIAPIVGVSDFTVRADIAGARNLAPDLKSGFRVDESTGEVFDDETAYTIATDDAKPVVIAEVRRSTVTGLDGKTYQAPAPSKPRQKPLTDTAFSAVVDLTRVTDRLQAVVADPRFTRNADQISATNLSDLIRARDAINQAISALQ